MKYNKLSRNKPPHEHLIFNDGSKSVQWGEYGPGTTGYPFASKIHFDLFLVTICKN